MCFNEVLSKLLIIIYIFLVTPISTISTQIFGFVYKCLTDICLTLHLPLFCSVSEYFVTSDQFYSSYMDYYKLLQEF